MSPHSRRRVRIAFAAHLCALASATGHAQDRTSSAGNELLLAAGPTVVTAARRPQRASDVPAAVTVITEETIRASGAPTLIDLLRNVPGVEVTQFNAAAAEVSIRGFNQGFADKLLVMVDGRSIYQELYGGVLWFTEPLLMLQIKRIEIVRGPGSALYGANAFNGVINIITKSPEERAKNGAKASVRTLVGERDSEHLETLVAGGKATGFSYDLGLGYNREHGPLGTGAGYVPNSFSTPIITADLQERLRAGSLRFSLGHTDAVADLTEEGITIDSGRWNRSYFDLTYAEDKARNPATIRAYANLIKLSAGNGADFTGSTYDVDAQQTHRLAAGNTLVYGASFRHTDETSFVTGPASHAQELYALYAQDEARIARHTSLFAGLRMDADSIHGTQLSPRISLMRRLAGAQTLRLSFGTAFHSPTLLDTFSDFSLPIMPGVSYKVAGNRRLRPERVANWEIGYRKDLHAGFLGVTAYYNQLTDLIDTVPTAFLPAPFPPGTPSELTWRNAHTATAAGVTFETEARLGRDLKAFFNYNYQRTVQEAGQPVALTPAHKLNVGLQTSLQSLWQGYLAGHFVDDELQTSTSTNTLTRIPAYFRLDARLGYRLGGKASPWTLGVVVTNLLGDGHLEASPSVTPSTTPDVTRQRRTAYLSLTGRF